MIARIPRSPVRMREIAVAGMLLQMKEIPEIAASPIASA
jgi:hypothetical protein